MGMGSEFNNSVVVLKAEMDPEKSLERNEDTVLTALSAEQFAL